jgi:hypothetical protein
MHVCILKPIPICSNSIKFLVAYNMGMHSKPDESGFDYR